MAHIPVLQKEVIEYLDPKPNENFIDCTLGEGGHTYAILEKTAPKGRVLGIDLQLRIRPKPACRQAGKRLILAENNFANLKNIVENNKFKPINGILFDLGMSSWHLDESGRGFSFQKREPLDMRFDSKSNLLTAAKIVNYWSKFEIERILRDFGEEPRAGKIAEGIIEARKWKPLENTLQLKEVVNRAGADPRQTFQALRIAVNQELDNLTKALDQAVELLGSGGRLVVISFHSLEDRIAKHLFKNPSFEILTKKPIIPGREEIRNNPRSRSAKLRAIKIK